MTLLAHKCDFTSDAVIEGAIVDIHQPRAPRFVDIRIDGNFFGSQFACGVTPVAALDFLDQTKRQEILRRNAGENAVPAGFRFEIGPYVSAADEHSFELVDHESGEILFANTRCLQREYKSHLHKALGKALLGRLSVVGIEQRRVHFGGHFAVPGHLRGVDAEGGDNLDFRIRPTENETAHPVPPYSTFFALEGGADIPPEGATIKVVDPTGTIKIPSATGIQVPGDFDRQFAEWLYPADSQMKRTMGFASHLNYYFDGYQTFRMLDDVLTGFTGEDIRSRRRILDWGCGCGRVTQHLINRLPKSAIYGADIDGDNAAWCAANFPKGIFLQAQLEPPLAFPDGSMDLVFGISVMTHLTEEAQFAWLKEIARLLAPEGIAVLTVCGEHAIFNRYVTPAVYREYMSRGISDSTRGEIMRDALGSSWDYYRETYQRRQYIMRNWQAFFDVVAIKAAAHNNYQDAVILRKRSR